MSDVSHWSVFVNAALINNFVLAYFLGLCPFFGVSARLETAARMGGAVSFVMLVASVCAYLINLLLGAVNAPYLRIISYILSLRRTARSLDSPCSRPTVAMVSHRLSLMRWVQVPDLRWLSY
jgi:electron transport complex protein RnfA